MGEEEGKKKGMGEEDRREGRREKEDTSLTESILNAFNQN